MAKWVIQEGTDPMITAEDLEAFGYWSHEPTKSNKTPTEMVKEYAKVSGQKLETRLYRTLIIEECNEWLVEKVVVDELKELADLLYVIYGYANARGWDVEEALRRVHENNMGRMYQPDGTIERRNDGKIIKNKDYPKVDLSDLIC
jgi:predicted house-cleaning noncanonical NTP pyrophosphatase (MazG superfamily)